MKQGDLVEIHWLDVQEHSTGDPAGAYLAKRKSVAYFWERKKYAGVKCVVTTTTIDNDLTGQNGWCMYPKACIRRMKKVKRS